MCVQYPEAQYNLTSPRELKLKGNPLSLVASGDGRLFVRKIAAVHQFDPSMICLIPVNFVVEP